jgi:thiol-disulfide isomerase/thioredoxin
MQDDDLLSLVKAERASSIGFDHDETLTAQRERALNYQKGVMSDLPSLANRSSAVSSDIADAIDTLLPDLQEIFTGGDDVASFIPTGQEDEDKAQQETDYVNHVVFNENPGWLMLHSMFKDALQSKTGVVKFWAEECSPEEEELKGKTAIELQMAQEGGEILNVKASEGGMAQVEPLYDFTVKKPTYKKIKIAAIAPEDFTVAADTTIQLSDTTYCAMRARPRAQDLVLQGYSQEDVDKLSAYGREDDDGVATARDQAGEHENSPSGSMNQLRKVEIVEHVIRVDGKLWSVVTGENESVLLRKEEIERVPFAAITPYIVTHRFYGESVADRLIQYQKINTALTRGVLDSIYFALNQRMEVAENTASINTMPDLLRNEPGVPVRVKQSGTVTPIAAGSPNVDYFAALEYFQTKIEQRTGITRAAQGLTADTLHETAKGALALLTAAQKRVRLIARIFAETGVKDLFLGVHALIRQHVTRASKVRLRNKWVDVDPTSWGARNDMTIEIGLGASGREADLIALNQEMAAMEKVILLQGGQPTGPIITFEHVYNLYRRILEKLGNKAPEKYGQDPKEAEPQPPKPDPEMVKVEKDAELKQMELQAKGQLQATELQGKAMLEQAKLRQAEEQAIREHELKIQQMQAEIQLKRDIAAKELALKRELLAAELQMKRELNEQQAQIARENNQERNFIARENNSAKIDAQVNVGGDPG